MVERVSGVGTSLSVSLSLWEFCEGNLEGGLAGDPEG